jgi:hypothetical protein
MFRLPFSFIITGMVCFFLFQVLNLIDLAGWIGEPPRNPEGWFRVHLLVLGWATMIAMGAVYQLINVVLQSNIYSEKLGFFHYVVFTVGSAGLLAGFYQANFMLIGISATIAYVGIILFTINMCVTLLRAGKWTPVTLSAGLAVLYLFFTGLSGMAMGLNFAFGWWSFMHEQIFQTHIWLGSLGWFGLLIIGFSFKMLPMFYLSHGHSELIQKYIVILWNAAVITGAAAFLLDWHNVVKWLALLFLVCALTLYNKHIKQIRKAKHKPNPGEGIRWSIIAVRVLLAVGIVLLLLSFLFPDRFVQSNVITMLGWIYLWGFVAMTMLAYLSKIVPFLWWTHKYGPQVGKRKIPTMSDLIDDRHVRIGLSLIAVSLILLVAGIGTGYLPLVTVGGILLSLSSIGYMSLVAKVFLR